MGARSYKKHCSGGGKRVLQGRCHGLMMHPAKLRGKPSEGPACLNLGTLAGAALGQLLETTERAIYGNRVRERIHEVRLNDHQIRSLLHVIVVLAPDSSGEVERPWSHGVKLRIDL